MKFDLAYWKAAIKAYLPETKEAFKTGVYTTLCAASFLPLLLAYQNPETLGAAMFALGNILGGLGSDLLASKLQEWFGKKDPDLDEIASLLQESLAEDDRLHKELDAVLKTLETIPQQDAQLSEADKAWFHQTLQEELEGHQSELRFIYTEGGSYYEYLVIEQGDFVIRDKITYIYNGEDVTPLVEAYFRSMSEACQRLPLGIIDKTFADNRQTQQIQLKDIYTDLDVVSIPRKEDEDERMYGWRLVRAEEGEREAVLDAVSHEELPYIVLLGDPGSGKTTFINYLTYRLITKPDGLPEAFQNRPVIRITLREVSEFIPTGATAGTASMLWQALGRDISRRYGPAGAEKVLLAIQQKACQQPCILLLDGLDEVSEANQRRQNLLQAVQELLACLVPGSHVILTARPYAYAKEEWRLKDFTDLTLAPFNQPQIDHFVLAWYKTVKPMMSWDDEITQKRTKRLQEAIAEKDYLGDLGSRPILLTLMTTLHTSHGTLPEDRADLYEESVDLLLSRWQRKTNAEDSGKDRDDEAAGEGDERIRRVFSVGETRVRKVLEQIAYDAHQTQRQLKTVENAQMIQAQSAEITHTQLVSAFSSILPDDLHPRVLIDYLEQRAGLLIAREDGVFIFPHRSFQEFLAACHILNQPDSTPNLLGLLKDDRDWWREVYLLAAGKKKRGGLGDAVGLITALLPESVAEKKSIQESDWHAASLAGEALLELRILEEVENREAYDYLTQRVRGWLTKLVEEGRLAPRPRLKAGDILGKIGDDRKGVNVITHQDVRLPDIDWVLIPAGKFLMGSTDKDERAYANEKSQYPVVLPDFWISRYPLTHAQFEPFVHAKGYQEPSYWTKTGWAWLQGAEQDFAYIEDEQIRHFFEENQRQNPLELRGQPFFWEAKPWNGCNRPVVGVNWYEAYAYTQWLQEKYRQYDLWPGAAGRGGSITLLSDAEWEKAVRGESGLIYPWSDDWQEDAANTEEAKLNTTSPVGLFPKGKSRQYGLLDGAGNVWEWTRSLWGKDWNKPDFIYRYDPEDGRRENVESDQFRVLRGGSFYGSRSGARCAFRGWDNPDFWNYNIGFRLCLCP